MTSDVAGKPQVRVRWAAVTALTLVCAAVWLGRASLAGPRFVFLWWNLALAWVPWGVSAWLSRPRGPLATGAAGLAWLVFFPNAPYLITDLVHLKARPPVPLSVDVLMLASFGLAGLVLGWTSLDVVRQRLESRWGRPVALALVTGCVGATGFGVYLGRFLRWNSWDVVTSPSQVLEGARAALVDGHALAFSAAFAALVGAGYLMFIETPPRRA